VLRLNANGLAFIRVGSRFIAGCSNYLQMKNKQFKLADRSRPKGDGRDFEKRPCNT
jgi:hypothetical protein